MNRYSRIFHHIDTKDVKKKHLENIEVQRIKEQENGSSNVENLINSSKPPIFWKEKPLVKKQLAIWSLDQLKEIIVEINNIELLCKKNPQISNSIFFNFFSSTCKKANSFS